MHSTEPSQPTVEIDIDALRELVEASGPNRNEQADNFLYAAISQGINTTGWLISIGAQLDFHPGHIAARLVNASGGNPIIHKWRVDDDQRYHLHVPASESGSRNPVQHGGGRHGV